MRNILALIFSVLVATNIFAQEVKETKKRVSAHLTANYTVNAAKKKEGAYIVKNEQDIVLVRGIYKDDKKVGNWFFYSDNGDLVQKYDYDNNKLTHFAVNPKSILKVNYEVYGANAVSKEDVALPIKIGGDDYLFYLLFNEKKLPEDLKTVKGGVSLIYEFKIDAQGKLTEWLTHYKGDYYDRTEKNSIKSLPLDVYEFIPGRIKNEPKAGFISLETRIGINDLKLRPAYNDIPKSAN